MNLHQKHDSNGKQQYQQSTIHVKSGSEITVKLVGLYSTNSKVTFFNTNFGSELIGVGNVPFKFIPKPVTKIDDTIMDTLVGLVTMVKLWTSQIRTLWLRWDSCRQKNVIRLSVENHKVNLVASTGFNTIINNCYTI